MCSRKKREEYVRWQVENISVANPPLLKVYYWECMKIDCLNEKLLDKHEKRVEHNVHMMPCLLHTVPLKIKCWLKNIDEKALNLKMRRIQNCNCRPMQTRVGFNQFRFLYHCPHRRLVHTNHEVLRLQPGELTPVSLTFYYYLQGNYKLTFELTGDDKRVVLFHFHVKIGMFEPPDCLLTPKLLPVDLREHRRVAQPIWVFNRCLQPIQILFKGANRGFRLINPHLIVPQLSVWPLIVEYRPCKMENNLTLNVTFNNNRYKLPLTCEGYLEKPPEKSTVPLRDHDCKDFAYVIYPNRVVFESQQMEDRYQLVTVHNYDQKCVHLKWQTYSIKGYFALQFEPSEFVLKPHHTKLCIIQLKAFDKALTFKRIPVILEAHQVFDKETQIAQQELTEVESIDDPKWKRTSYLTHMLLQADVTIHLQTEDRVDISKIITNELAPESPQFLLIGNELTSPSISSTATSKDNTTIIEKLFWDYLSRTNYSRNTSKISKYLNYEEVASGHLNLRKSQSGDIDQMSVLATVATMMADACRELGRNHVHVPIDYLKSS